MTLDLESIPVAGEGVKRLSESEESSPLLDQLRQRYERVRDDKTHDFDIPGYDGLLVCRYRRMTADELSELRTDAENLLEYNVAFLTAATVELFGRDRDGKLKPLADHPVKWDMDLAAILGFDTETVRDTLIRAFGGVEHDLTILNHGDTVADWMVNGRTPDLGK